MCRAGRGLTALALLVLAGCSSAPKKSAPPPHHPPARAEAGRSEAPVLPAAGSGRGGYYKDDGPGDNPPPGLDRVPDAEVRIEPYSPRANRPYVALGKSYTPLTAEQPFVQLGAGSWYGKKFHGQRTSSGELYDMYKMTAAHPTLPIPSYARVTSIANGKQVIVRINDRGPFHSSRIIDVSYTAALQLGLLGKGSHEVKIERLLRADIARMTAEGRQNPAPPGPPPASVAPEGAAASTAAASGSGFYLQLGAYAQAAHAESARARLTPHADRLRGLEVVRAGPVYRLYGGPFASHDEASVAARALPDSLSLKPIVVQR